MQTTMVNAPITNFSPLLVSRYGKLTKWSTQRHYQANEGKSGLEAESVQALGALRSLRFKKKLPAEKRHETHFLSNEDKEKWIEDYVERETSGARKRVEDAEAVVQQEQEDMKHAEITELMTKEPEKTSEEMMVAIGDSLCDLASPDNGEDGEDEDEETEQGKLSDDEESGWVMSIITRTVEQRMERFRQKQMKLDELTQPGWEDAADHFCESDKKYGSSKLMVPAIVQLETDDDAVAPAPTTFRKHLDCLEIVPRISQLPHGTSRPASSHMRLVSMKMQSITSVSGLEPAAQRDTSPLLKAKPDKPASFYPCI